MSGDLAAERSGHGDAPRVRPLLTARDVAALLGVTVSYWYRRRRALEAAGFPPPVPALGNRWDPVAIERWLAAQRGEALAEPADWEQRLAARLDTPAAGRL
jgi:predicted DNA-binding transcriptional regulator AlpA